MEVEHETGVGHVGSRLGLYLQLRFADPPNGEKLLNAYDAGAFTAEASGGIVFDTIIDVD